MSVIPISEQSEESKESSFVLVKGQANKRAAGQNSIITGENSQNITSAGRKSHHHSSTVTPPKKPPRLNSYTAQQVTPTLNRAVTPVAAHQHPGNSISGSPEVSASGSGRKNQNKLKLSEGEVLVKSSVIEIMTFCYKNMHLFEFNWKLLNFKFFWIKKICSPFSNLKPPKQPMTLLKNYFDHTSLFYLFSSSCRSCMRPEEEET